MPLITSINMVVDVTHRLSILLLSVLVVFSGCICTSSTDKKITEESTVHTQSTQVRITSTSSTIKDWRNINLWSYLRKEGYSTSICSDAKGGSDAEACSFAVSKLKEICEPVEDTKQEEECVNLLGDSLRRTDKKPTQTYRLDADSVLKDSFTLRESGPEGATSYVSYGEVFPNTAIMEDGTSICERVATRDERKKCAEIRENNFTSVPTPLNCTKSVGEYFEPEASCLLSQAIRQDNKNLCKEIPGTTLTCQETPGITHECWGVSGRWQKLACMAYFIGDLNLCENETTAGYKNNCIYYATLGSADERACFENDNAKDKSNCYRWFAMKKGDAKICDKIKDIPPPELGFDKRSEFYRCILPLAYTTKNPALCYLWDPDFEQKHQCLSYVALSKMDKWVCELIDKEYSRSICYQRVQ